MCSRLHNRAATAVSRTAGLARTVARFGNLVSTPTDQAVCKFHELPVPGDAALALVDDGRHSIQVAVQVALFQITQRALDQLCKFTLM